MRPSRLLVLVAGLALCGGAQSAFAQSKAEIQRMDRNGDGVVTREEWQGPEGAFRLHDHNHDGVLSGDEVWDSNRDSRDRDFARFREYDVNNDGFITRNEWHGPMREFRELDRNRDNRLSRNEFRDFRQERIGTSGREFPNAYMAGYERGWAEGRMAGRRGDPNRNHRWDLENRLELRSADSGYNPRFGSRAQYQEGYRDGFTAGYTDEWWR